MKNFRKKSTSFLLVINLLLSSCSKEIDRYLDLSDDKEISIQKNRFSGEEIFQGIFFGYGNFAKKLPLHKDIVNQINSAPAHQKKLFEDRFKNFVSTIKSKKTNYFENFRLEILSGDNIRIQEAIKIGSINIYENLDIILPEFQSLMKKIESDKLVHDISSKGDMISQKDLELLGERYKSFLTEENLNQELAPCSWAVACVYYAAIAVHNTAAITANLAIAGAVAVYLAVKLWGPKIDGKIMDEVSPEEYLKFELFIQEISNASQN
ncbi:hypothetical protein D1000_05715 [Riemerella anatipestifer]|uniref:hypothetical protein n=1 Tax=Riemerella anatipestifer TaxID=34085 RepID=UPI00129E9678|nr:hypothetical protein [Riemerella anatipestifer]MRN16321.1 hypothetical protein [Riemerella anatipestifer]